MPLPLATAPPVPADPLHSGQSFKFKKLNLIKMKRFISSSSNKFENQQVLNSPKQVIFNLISEFGNLKFLFKRKKFFIKK